MKTQTSPRSKLPERSSKTGDSRSVAIPAAKASTTARLKVNPPATRPLIDRSRLPGEVTLPRVRLGYFKHEAQKAYVVGSFNGWNLQATPMHRDQFGDWSVELELPPGEHHYRFFVDGVWQDDPTAKQTALNAFGGFDAIIAVE
ncbi:MAG: glycogen-binding domain-containing protein [Opitutus sp.]